MSLNWIGAVSSRGGDVYPLSRAGLRAAGWLATALLLLAGTAVAAGNPKLVAPIYPGAVPAVTGKAQGGKPHDCEGRCFLTKDSIEKVKAFYDKAVGPLGQTPQPYGQRSYTLLMERGQPTEEGTPFSAMAIHALGPPVKIPTDPAKWQLGYGMGVYGWNTAFAPIGILTQMVAWTPDMEDPLMYPYKPRAVDALARKYSRTQSYFYVVDAATGKNRADVLADQLGNRVGKLKQDAMMGNLAAQQGIAQSMGKEGEKINAEDVQDDPEFNRIMQRKPALQQKYVGLVQKVQQQMMAGKGDEAEKTMDESDRLLRSDPEMAKLMQKYDARDQRREAVSAKAEAQGSAAEADAYNQFSKKSWDLAVQALETVDKEGYVTYIVLDFSLVGKGIVRDRAKLESSDNWLLYVPGELTAQVNGYRSAVEQGIVPEGDSPEKVAAAREAGKPAASGSAKASAPAASGSAASSTASAPAAPAPQQPAAAPPAEQKPSTADQAKKGLKSLKKLF